ncbi:MAG: phage holin family protein [Thermoleophilaceae bacterium]|nr:phage holin family protein [Thermoleophilaceae bacterium]
MAASSNNNNNNNNPDLRDRPVGELLKQLSEETTTLVKQELELAKAEMAEKGKQAGTGAGLFGGAGVTGLLALIALTLTLIYLLGTAMEDWIAALIVTALWGAVAGVLALTGKKKLQEAGPPVPEQTVETVKEDVEWAKTQR